MINENTPRSSSLPGGGRFATTHWSVVLAAGRSSSQQCRKALSCLCETYWFPLYAFLRRRGYDSEQAGDHTQAFFARMLEKHDLRLADPQRGKFRSFLLAALKHFLANEIDRIRAQKRGGGRPLLSLDFEHAEGKYTREPVDQLTPQKLFERSWALTVLERVMTRLQDESARQNKKKLFEHLKVYLTAEKGSVSHREAAAELEMTESAVKVAVHRLRRRYRVLLRDEIAQTVTNEDQIDEEIRDLFAALA